MNIGRVDIKTDLNEVVDGGTVRHVLSFSIRRARDFPTGTMNRSPEACLVFRRSVPGEPLKNPFERVCTLDEFFILPNTVEATGTRDELYRDSTYYWEYDDYNTALADQEDLSNQVHTFYNNLNNYVLGHSGPESSKEYVFPDYEIQLLNSLIIRHRTLKFENKRDEDKILVLEKSVIPLLSANYSMYESLKEAAELLLTHAEDTKKNVIDVVLFKDRVASLKQNVSRINRNVTANRTRIQDGVANLNVIDNLLQGASMDEDDRNNILKQVKVTGYALNPTAEVPDILTPPEAAQLASQLLPGIAFVEEAEEDRYTDLSTIERLLDLITDFGTSIERERDKKVEESEELRKDIQIRLGELQEVEARLKQIRPTIDITNPESAWYLTINVNR